MTVGGLDNEVINDCSRNLQIPSGSIIPIIDLSNALYMYIPRKLGELAVAVKLFLLKLYALSQHCPFVLVTGDGDDPTLKINRVSGAAQAGLRKATAGGAGFSRRVLHTVQYILTQPWNPLPHVFLFRNSGEADSLWAAIQNALHQLGIPRNIRSIPPSPPSPTPTLRVGPSDIPMMLETARQLKDGTLPDDSYLAVLRPRLPVTVIVTTDGDPSKLLERDAAATRKLLLTREDQFLGGLWAMGAYDVGAVARGIFQEARKRYNAPNASGARVEQAAFAPRLVKGDYGVAAGGEAGGVGWGECWKEGLQYEDIDAVVERLATSIVGGRHRVKLPKPRPGREHFLASWKATASERTEIDRLTDSLLVALVREIGDVVPSKPFAGGSNAFYDAISKLLHQSDATKAKLDDAFSKAGNIWTLATSPSPVAKALKWSLVNILCIEHAEDEENEPSLALWERVLIRSGVHREAGKTDDLFGTSLLGSAVERPLMPTQLSSHEVDHLLPAADKDVAEELRLEVTLVGWHSRWATLYLPQSILDAELERQEALEQQQWADIEVSDATASESGTDYSLSSTRSTYEMEHYRRREGHFNSLEALKPKVAEALQRWSKMFAATSALAGKVDNIYDVLISVTSLRPEPVSIKSPYGGWRAWIFGRPTTSIASSLLLCIEALENKVEWSLWELVKLLETSPRATAGVPDRTAALRVLRKVAVELKVPLAFDFNLEHIFPSRSTTAEPHYLYILHDLGGFEGELFKNPLVATKALAPRECTPPGAPELLHKKELLAATVIISRLFPSARTISPTQIDSAYRSDCLRMCRSSLVRYISFLGSYDDSESTLSSDYFTWSRSTNDPELKRRIVKEGDTVATLVFRLKTGTFQVTEDHLRVRQRYDLDWEEEGEDSLAQTDMGANFLSVDEESYINANGHRLRKRARISPDHAAHEDHVSSATLDVGSAPSSAPSPSKMGSTSNMTRNLDIDKTPIYSFSPLVTQDLLESALSGFPLRWSRNPMERPLVLVDRIDFEAEDPKFAAYRAAGCQFLASDWIFSAGHDPEDPAFSIPMRAHHASSSLICPGAGEATSYHMDSIDLTGFDDTEEDVGKSAAAPGRTLETLILSDSD